MVEAGQQLDLASVVTGDVTLVLWGGADRTVPDLPCDRE